MKEYHIIILYIIVTFACILSIFLYLYTEEKIVLYKNKLITSSERKRKIYEFNIKKDSSSILELNIFGYQDDFKKSVHILQTTAFYNDNGKITEGGTYQENTGSTGDINEPVIEYKLTGNTVEILVTPSDKTKTIWELIAKKI
tara:strand:+ start:230 stop:658 length:429 start_codon:yes stop_codon:yes gene_type:complete